jgi:hypothetical protein
MAMFLFGDGQCVSVSSCIFWNELLFITFESEQPYL